MSLEVLKGRRAFTDSLSSSRHALARTSIQLPKGASSPRSTPYLRKPLCDEWRQYSHLAKDTWAFNRSNDYALCASVTRPLAGCNKAQPFGKLWQIILVVINYKLNPQCVPLGSSISRRSFPPVAST